MGNFIAQYWVEFAFGILIAIIGWFFKRYLKLEKQNTTQEREEFKKLLLDEMDKKNQHIQNEEKNLHTEIENLKAGVLSFQGAMFKEHCRGLINSEEIITLQQYEDITKEHNAYNGLGGNHDGDSLFQIVEQKFQTQQAMRNSNIMPQ